MVGGGVMGASAAWRLARRGAQVTLLEQFGPGHDRGSSHGSSRIFRLAYAEPLYVRLAVRAQQLWRELESVTGPGVLALCGALDHGPEPVTAALARELAAAGQPGELLSVTEAGARWPGLRFDTSVLWHAGGRLHADRAVAALLRAAAGAGAQIRHHTRVAGVASRGGRAEVRIADGSVLAADAAVIAAGGWLPGVFGGVAALPPARVTQEQPAHFPAAAPEGWPSFIHHGGGELPPGEGIYGAGGPDGIKIGRHAIGPVTDPDHRDRSIDQARVDDLAGYARRWLPGVDHTRPAPLTCLYTTLPGGDFLLEPAGPVTVLSACSGHGFKHAPAVGELAAGLVLDGAAVPERFTAARRLPAA